MKEFSILNRKNNIDQLQESEFDLLVIGGGITGAGIALDAVTRGLKVALIEKNDFSSGTSSKSTKLIHGGLRYLKQFDFWLVKEVGTERAIVHKLAPHLVVPEKMLLPIIEEGTYGSWLTSFGLKIYDILAHVEGDDKRKMLSKKEALKIEPLLPKKILEGAGYYAEYRTDDARLTIEVLKTAVNHSAKALNYCKAKEFIYKNKKVNGVTVLDTINNTTFDIKAKYIVNATGPWVDTLREVNKKSRNKPVKGKKLHLTKGVHLVLPFKKLPFKQSMYFDVPDGRMMFAIPRGKATYIGTTDTNYVEDINDVSVNQVDALYLISAVNNMFPNINLVLEDIQSSWAGLRPLIHEEGKSASELSRKDEIFEAKSGLISIAGGKLTGYRKMAERITDLVCKRLEKKYDVQAKPIQTKKLTLTGSNFKNYAEVQQYNQQVFKQIKEFGFSKKDAEILIHRFGNQTDKIIQKFHELTGDDFEIRMAKAELWFCLQYEMVFTPLDFFIRRTARLYFDIENIEKLKEPILQEFSAYFNWNNDTFND
ncbi:MAG: glycerol-3-phosphate dehydrogenase/oxidase, partial [Flavobacteriaceae bacterium]|nr:glycerol-3-phosphate dehydrogenase/oxidase [Flavobacteriaceae bacterium]